MKQEFSLIVISPAIDLPDEANYVVQLFEKGLANYHLRKPLWESGQAEEFLRAIPEIYHSRIVVHSHFDLADRYVLRGIHLNEENKKSLALYKKHRIVSASFHSFEGIKAETLSYEYVFLSPVFDSISKSGYKAAFNIKSLGDNISVWRIQNPLATKIFALGGIDSQNIGIIKRYGFSGAATIGAIWNNDNPVKAFTALQQAAFI